MSIGTDERFCGEMKNGKTRRDGSARVFHEAKFGSREFLEEKRRLSLNENTREGGKGKERGRGEEIYRWWHIGDDVSFRLY